MQEDEVFRKIATEYEPKNWAVIAKRLASEFSFKKRTGKQCRERYFWVDLDGIITWIPRSKRKDGEKVTRNF
jgi:hypothetical protein